MSFFDAFDRYMFNRMNDFFRGDYWGEEPPMLTAPGETTSTNKTLSVPNRSRGMLPAKLDMIEKPNEYLVNIELPGVKKEDIQVNVENGTLFIGAERKEEKREDRDRYHYSERRYGSIKRMIALPEQADAEKVKASFENGVLNLSFAKKPESASRKQISIS